MAEFVFDIGPEFFHDEGQSVVAHLRAPDARSIGQVPIGAGMVAIGGNGGGRRTPAQFREVELTRAGIASRDEQPAHGIAGAMPESAAAQLVVAGILAQQRGNDGGSHEIFNRAIRHSGSITLSVAFGPLSIAGLAIFRLTDSCEEPVPGILHVIERGAEHDSKFLFRGERRILAFIADCEEIRQSPKKAVI